MPKFTIDQILKEMLDSNQSSKKQAIIQSLEGQLTKLGFQIVDSDTSKPWGAYFRVDNKQKANFCSIFFEQVKLPDSTSEFEVSPKLLLVEPGTKLSWQKHDRRAEFWRVIYGPVGVALSDTNEQPQEPSYFSEGETIEVREGVRHRLIGLKSWGVVAEIWIHTNPQNLSNEADIIRLQDDYGR